MGLTETEFRFAEILSENRFPAGWVRNRVLKKPQHLQRHNQLLSTDKGTMATTTVPFMAWKDSWIVGVQEIDAQHKNLVSLLNKLHQAMTQGEGKDALGSILDSLVSYTKAHFAAEERLMQQSGYPDFIAHKREHTSLAEKVLNFQRTFKSGGS